MIPKIKEQNIFIYDENKCLTIDVNLEELLANIIFIYKNAITRWSSFQSFWLTISKISSNDILQEGRSVSSMGEISELAHQWLGLEPD